MLSSSTSFANDANASDSTKIVARKPKKKHRKRHVALIVPSALQARAKMVKREHSPRAPVPTTNNAVGRKASATVRNQLIDRFHTLQKQLSRFQNTDSSCSANSTETKFARTNNARTVDSEADAEDNCDDDNADSNESAALFSDSSNAGDGAGADGISGLARSSIERELAKLGGLAAYQDASIRGHQQRFKFNTAKYVVDALASTLRKTRSDISLSSRIGTNTSDEQDELDELHYLTALVRKKMRKSTSAMSSFSSITSSTSLRNRTASSGANSLVTRFDTDEVGKRATSPRVDPSSCSADLDADCYSDMADAAVKAQNVDMEGTCFVTQYSWQDREILLGQPTSEDRKPTSLVGNGRSLRWALTDPIRVLDVGALTNHYLAYSQPRPQAQHPGKASNLQSPVALSVFDCTAIDLNPRHVSVKRQDFFELDVGLLRSSFDVVVLSLVINFVGDKRQRGAMLRTSHELLRMHGFCFVILPAACLVNSRYMTEANFCACLRRLGFLIIRYKRSPKLSFYMLQKKPPEKITGNVFKAVNENVSSGRLVSVQPVADDDWRSIGHRVVCSGSSRNNFAIWFD